jgi:CRP/FNR family transcriptional activator FtrB
MIPSANIRKGMARDPALSLAMVTELAGCFREVVKTAKNLKLRSAVERLANYLLRLDETHGGSGRFDLPTEKRILASYLGMTPENLSRAFNTLGPYGVDVDGASIRLAKKDDLMRLAKPTPLIDDPEY